MPRLRYDFIFFIVLSVFLFSIQPVYSQDNQIVSLEQLIKEALENNPRIHAAYNNWKAATYAIKSAQGLPDPTARYTFFGDSIETRVGPQEHKFGASQAIPFPGKLDLKGKSQAKEAEMLREKYEAAKREVIKDVKFVYYDIYWVDKAVQITEEEKAILESLEKVAQRKYESNLSPQQDVIKAQVELSKLIDKIFLLRQNRKSLTSKMNSILSRSGGGEIGSAGPVDPAEFTYQLEELHKKASATRQELLAANLAVERARYERSLAGLDFFPDLTLGFDYIQVDSGDTTHVNDGKDAWMGTVAFNVPIWFEKLGAQYREKEAILEASKRGYEDRENSVRYEVEDIYFKITTYKDIISLYKTALVPQTEQAFEAAKTGYETGNVDFLNWLDSERVLLQTRLAYYKAIVDYQKSIAYLERVVGMDL
ncbi:MAG: TolC family protein [Candidatus Omnitrophica bacterium]|nr:TolC family protein [Candidatus Omnitrophota bacterium]